MTLPASIPHPLIDSRGDGSVRTESRGRIIYLSAGRADLLTSVRADGGRHILVTDSLSRLTEPYLQLMREVGGAWAVRSPDGALRDGMSGRQLDHFQDAGTPAAGGELADGFLRPVVAAARLRFTIARRHRARPDALLGLDAETVSTWSGGPAPAGWGIHEPAGRMWSRHDLTDFARGLAPQPTRIIVTGTAARPLSATVTTTRTKRGLEETTDGVSAIGAPGSAAADTVLATVPDLLETIASDGVPLMAVVYGEIGSRDLTRAPVVPPIPHPLGLLIGPPAVREMGLDTASMSRRFGARIAGRRRVPSLVFPFTASAPETWEALRSVLSAIGHDRLTAAMGRDTTRLLRLTDADG